MPSHHKTIHLKNHTGTEKWVPIYRLRWNGNPCINRTRYIHLE